MHFAIPNNRPDPMTETAELKEGWLVVIILFLMTIATAVAFHALLHLPPFLGMTTGLSYFFIYGYTRRLRARRVVSAPPVDVFRNVAQVEWDTMLFFFGVIMCVGGLSEMGYLAMSSQFLYQDLGPVWGSGPQQSAHPPLPTHPGRPDKQFPAKIAQNHLV